VEVYELEIEGASGNCFLEEQLLIWNLEGTPLAKEN
jgi:hypothetical protein